MSFQSLSIRPKLLSVLCACAVGIVAVGAVTLWTLEQVKVGGPLYTRIVDGKDLIADIQPPAAYLVETQLTAYELAHATAPEAMDVLLARAERLEEAYEQRHALWQRQLEDSPFKSALVKDSYRPAREYYDTWRRELVPAVRAGNVNRVRAIVEGVLTEKFAAHRRAIDETRKLTTERNAAVEAEAAQQTKTSWWILLGSLVALLGFLAFAGRVLVTQVIGTLEAVTRAIEHSATGDLTTKVQLAAGNQERVAASFEKLLATLRESIAKIAENATTVASASEELTAVSHTMNIAATDTSTQANTVSGAADDVMQNLNTVSAASREMSAAINEIATNASDAALTANRAVQVVEETTRTIDKLGESSARIGEVVRLISRVAEQTNLLALNASIEAARAGTAGKGFAVVASEVKELAAQTTRATRDIAERIHTIQGDVKAAVSAIQEIGEIVNQINQVQATIASAVEEQTATTREINHSLGEASLGGSQIAHNIGSVVQCTQETTSAATQTRDAAAELASLATTMQRLVGQFRYQ